MFGHRTGVPNARLDLLRSLPIFAKASDEQLAQFDAQLYETTVPAGQTVITEGQSGREAFIIVDGTAEILHDGTVIATAGRGDILGEIALIENSERSATVRAVTELTVLAMSPSQFSTLMNDSTTAEWINAQISERQRKNHDRTA